MAQKEELLQFIYHGREERHLEYKTSMNWTEATTQEKVIKTALAFSNIADGGTIVFGVKEAELDTFVVEGMSNEFAASFNQDDIQDKVNKYADPYVHVVVNRIEDNGMQFVLIQVRQFDSLPVVCKKASATLQQGQIYTRPRNKNESTLVKSQTELREILDLAIDNGIRNFFERNSRLGIRVQDNSPSSREKFDSELEGL